MVIRIKTVVQTVDSAIHWINHYPVDKVSGKSIHYPVDRHLSGTTGSDVLASSDFLLSPRRDSHHFLLKGSILNQEKMQWELIKWSENRSCLDLELESPNLYHMKNV